VNEIHSLDQLKGWSEELVVVGRGPRVQLLRISPIMAAHVTVGSYGHVLYGYDIDLAAARKGAKVRQWS
jgi:hypothetical protein